MPPKIHFDDAHEQESRKFTTGQIRRDATAGVPATAADRQLALAQQRALYSAPAPSDSTPLPVPGSKPTPMQLVGEDIKPTKRNPNELDHDPYADANKQNQTNPTTKLEPAPAATQPTLARDGNAPVANATDLTTKQAEPTAASTTAPTAEKPVTAKPTDVQPAQIIESPKPVAAEPPKPQQAADTVKPAPAVQEAPKPQPVAEAPKPQPAGEAPTPAVAAEASRPQPVVQQSALHAAEPKAQLVTEVPKAPSQAVHIATAEAMKPAVQATVQAAPKLEGTITHDAAPKSNDRSIAANKSAEQATFSGSKLSGQSASARATEGSDASTRNESRKETRTDARTESRAESRSDIRDAAREFRGDKRVASDAAFGTHAPAAHDGGSKSGGTSIETGSHGSTGVKHDADTKQDGGNKHDTQGKVEGTTQGKAEGNKQVSDATKHEVDAKHDASVKHEANQEIHEDASKGVSAAVGSHGDSGVRTGSGMWTMNWRGLPAEEMVCVKLREGYRL